MSKKDAASLKTSFPPDGIIQKLKLKPLHSLQDLEDLIHKLIKERENDKRRTMVVAGGTCGRARGSQDILHTVRDELDKAGLGKSVTLRASGCLGYCDQEPLILILPERIFYPRVIPSQVSEIVTKTAKNGTVVEDLLWKDPESGKRISCIDDLPFYKKQVRVISGNNEYIDPGNILDYLAMGG